ncbi:MAG: ankyrin repeat domain-containing protein, partial [Bdellovibrionia bacterium]
MIRSVNKESNQMLFSKMSLLFSVFAFLYGFSGEHTVYAAEFKLLKAIQLNQTKKALDIIKKKKNPWFFQKKSPLNEFLDQKDSNGDCALITATRNGNIRVLTSLLENGASVDIQDRGGDTALHWAVSNGRLNIAEVLLSAKASIETQNRRGSTPLITGILTKRDEMVKYLLQKGADSNARFSDDIPALSLTLKHDQIDLFWALIQTEAKINDEDQEGKTALHYAISQENTDIATWLVSNGAQFGAGKRPEIEELAWFQETLLDYLSNLTDPVLVKSTVARYLFLSKAEGWLGTLFHSRFIEKSRVERLQNMELQIQQWRDRHDLQRCSFCREKNNEFYERNSGPANCNCFLCPTCSSTYIRDQMSGF